MKPNLNLLGTREPDTYGAITLDRIINRLSEKAVVAGHHLQALQSNAEHQLIDCIACSASS
jgi:3-dehydroquinate dehydratase-2